MTIAADRRPLSARALAFAVLRLGFVGLVLGVVLQQVGWGALSSALQQARPWVAVGAILLYLACAIVAALRWKVLLHPFSPRTPLVGLYLLQLVGGFFAQFLPGSVTADAVRGAYLARAQTNKVAAVSSALMERVIGISVNGALGVVALLLSPAALALFRLGRGGAALLLLLAVAGLAVAFIVARSAPAWAQRLPGPFQRVAEVGHTYTRHPRVLGLAALLSIAFFLSWAIAIQLLAYAARLPLDYATALLVLAVVNVAQFIPLTVSGLGVREGALVALLGALGHPAENALLLSLLVAVINLVVAVLGGLVVLSDYRVRETTTSA